MPSRPVAKSGGFALRDWIAPGIVVAAVVAGLTLLINGIYGRVDAVDRRIASIDEKIDRRSEALERRFVETNQRIDRVLEQQTTSSAQLSRIEGELSYIRGRVDRVAERVAAAPTVPTVPVPVADLTPAQADFFYQAIKAQKDAAFTPDLDLFKGQRIPGSLKTATVPEVVVDKIEPHWKGWMYTVARNGIAVIEPISGVVQTLVSLR